MCENNRLHKIQAIIYHKSLVKIIFQGFECLVDKNSLKSNILFFSIFPTQTLENTS